MEASESLPGETLLFSGETAVIAEEFPEEELSEDEDEVNEAELEDRESDQTEEDELVDRQIKALYENGWFTGDITYFNSALCEYKVEFRDDSSDYIPYHDIDGVEVILV